MERGTRPAEPGTRVTQDRNGQNGQNAQNGHASERTDRPGNGRGTVCPTERTRDGQNAQNGQIPRNGQTERTQNGHRTDMESTSKALEMQPTRIATAMRRSKWTGGVTYPRGREVGKDDVSYIVRLVVFASEAQEGRIQTMWRLQLARLWRRGRVLLNADVVAAYSQQHVPHRPGHSIQADPGHCYMSAVQRGNEMLFRHHLSSRSRPATETCIGNT